MRGGGDQGERKIKVIRHGLDIKFFFIFIYDHAYLAMKPDQLIKRDEVATFRLLGRLIVALNGSTFNIERDDNDND